MVAAVPYLVGSAEIGDMFGVSRQRVQQLIAQADFPKPTVVLAMGRVWKRRDIEEWGRAHGRLLKRPPRRPDPAE